MFRRTNRILEFDLESEVFDKKGETRSRNSIIDAIDQFANCTSDDSTWAQAVALVNARGADALTVGRLDRRTGNLLWARSSMSQDWLNEYVAQEYYECDPFLDVFSNATHQISAFGAQLSAEDGATSAELALNQGLSDAGYRALHGTRFANQADSTGRIVTLCFDNTGKQPDTPPDMDALAALSSLIATFVNAPKMSGDAGYLDIGVPMLSRREREVLSLLASGLQTARISERLGITETTVTKHFAAGRRKLGANTREHALFIAMRRGLIDL